MNVARLLGIAFCTISWLASAQVPTPPAQVAPPTPQPAPMILIKKSVVFIQGTYDRRSSNDHCFDKDNKPIDKCSLAGTGFLLFLPEPRLGPTTGFTYVVTNKHMVREPGLDNILGKGPFLKEIAVRINTQKPLAESGISFTFGKVPVAFPNGDLKIFVHPTDRYVDLAILSITLNPETLDYFLVQPGLFATPKLIADEKIDESNEVIFAGLFASYTGLLKNYPVVRHGKLAMISQERIPWMPGVSEDLILADVMSFGGNSGSPVFIRTGGDSGSIGNNRYFLLGVMQGFYSVESQVSVQTAELSGVAKENTGIAAVVPAQKISDILDSPRAVAARDLEVARQWFNQGKTKDGVALCKTVIDHLLEFDKYHSDIAAARNMYSEMLTQSGDKVGAALQLREARTLSRPNIIADDDKK